MAKRSKAPTAPPLLIHCGRTTYEADPDAGIVVIGRDEQAGVRIDHPMISRRHVRVKAGPDGLWYATDFNSRNGMYVHGRRLESTVIEDGLTITLGDRAGVEVRFGFVDPDEEITRRVSPSDGKEDDDYEDGVDPGIKAAGEAVRARRNELNITQRGLAAEGILNAGALIAFEKGRSWPRLGTQRKLEEVLQWAPGAISGIRNSYWSDADPDSVTTTVKDTSGEPMLVQAIATGVDTVETAFAALPPPSDSDFHARATAVLANLRQLDAIAANAALETHASPTLAVTVGRIRRMRAQLTILAAQSPKATLGQRLYAARRRLDLTEAEAAAAAQLTVEAIVSTEADERVPAATAAKIEALIAVLAQS